MKVAIVGRQNKGREGDPVNYEYISCDLDGTLMIIMLNRPDKLNACTGQIRWARRLRTPSIAPPFSRNGRRHFLEKHRRTCQASTLGGRIKNKAHNAAHHIPLSQ